MSVVSIGSTNINVGSQGGNAGVAQLSNLWGGTTNTSLNNIWTAQLYPRKTGAANFGYFSGKKFRVITLFSNNTSFGTVDFNGPAGAGVPSGNGCGSGYAWDYFVNTTVTIRATATYPHTFSGWYTLASGGTLLSTSSSVGLINTDWTTNHTVYAVFV